MPKRWVLPNSAEVLSQLSRWSPACFTRCQRRLQRRRRRRRLRRLPLRRPVVASSWRRKDARRQSRRECFIAKADAKSQLLGSGSNHRFSAVAEAESAEDEETFFRVTGLSRHARPVLEVGWSPDPDPSWFVWWVPAGYENKRRKLNNCCKQFRWVE